MDSAKLNDWLQVIGLFGVIASLIFVGLQMRQAHEIAVSEVYQARAALEMEFATAAANNPEFTSATAKLYAGDEEKITPAELVAIEYIIGSLSRIWENNYFQSQSGFLPRSHWSRTVYEMECALSSPFYRDLIRDWVFEDRFTRFLSETIAKVEKHPLDCWAADLSP